MSRLRAGAVHLLVLRLIQAYPVGYGRITKARRVRAVPFPDERGASALRLPIATSRGQGEGV